MEIQSSNIKRFWKQRSRQTPIGDPMSLVYFENDHEMQMKRVAHEKEIIFLKMRLDRKMRILDLGGGYGQWSLRFAPYVSQVTCVDYQQLFLERGRQIAKLQDIQNVKFIYSSICDFIVEEHFDRIFLSGILMYLNDDELWVVLSNIKLMLDPMGKVILMEPSSVLDNRFIIDNKYSDQLQDYYSAVYRTSNEFRNFFSKSGMELIEDFNLFSDGSQHDKYPETRQRVYVFKHDHA